MPLKLIEGHIVELKSGGPPLTITRIDGTDAICHWFVEDILKEKRFPLSALQKSERRPKSMTLEEIVTGSREANEAVR